MKSKTRAFCPGQQPQGALTFAFDISNQVTSHAQKSWPSQITVPALCVADIRYLPTKITVLIVSIPWEPPNILPITAKPSKSFFEFSNQAVKL